MPALQLCEAVASSCAASSESLVKERVQWIEAFTDKSRLTEFCESTDPSGHFESHSSGGHSEFQDRLRAIALRKEGMEKAEIASALNRPTKFVQTWWKKEPKEVPRPSGVHEYLKTEFWRDIEIVRGFGRGFNVYDDALHRTEWVDQMASGPAFKDGGSRLKYDAEGRMRSNGSQFAKEGVVPGQLPKLDKVVQRMLVEQGIEDRVLRRPGMLWYPDGSSMAIPHRHEAWTALLSFGSPRILTIDGHPVLLRDGDLILFGTQRHGVPQMCLEGQTLEDYSGRMSVVFFYMPTDKQLQGSEPWRAIVDVPSRKMVAMQRDAALGKSAEIDALRAGPFGAELAQLLSLGFSEEESVASLKDAKFDGGLAADNLVLSHGGREAWGTTLQFQKAERDNQIAALYSRLAELQCEREVIRTSADATNDCHDMVLDDAALAVQLQFQEESSCSDDWQERLILEQIQSLESVQDSDLRAVFAHYEEMLDAKDAEDWDGRGDLMVRHWRREHLHIEQQEQATLFSLGCCHHERVFFELLSLHSIRVLYDLRPDVQGYRHFDPSHLAVACKARGVVYKHVEIGRQSAYGILKHLGEDEGRNTLAELVWHAQRKRSAFLGSEENWRNDHRIAIAARLREAGHRVVHVFDGGVEDHPESLAMPDHIVGEEARLRMLQKKRRAGELEKPVKSAVSRSTEAVAQKLSKPRVEIDVGAELRKAETQRELCNTQRRLADLQRKADRPDVKAGLGPKLLHVNKWVKAEAVRQQEYLDAGKTKDGKDKPTKPDAALHRPTHATAATEQSSNLSSSASAPTAPAASTVQTDTLETQEEVMVECLTCNKSVPWQTLTEDGFCTGCSAGPVPKRAIECVNTNADDSSRNCALVSMQNASSGDLCVDHGVAQQQRWCRGARERSGERTSEVSHHINAVGRETAEVTNAALPARSTWRAKRSQRVSRDA